MMKMYIIDCWEAGGNGGGGGGVGVDVVGTDWMDYWSELDEIALRKDMLRRSAFFF